MPSDGVRLVHDPIRVSRWIGEQQGCPFTMPVDHGIGLESGGQMVAGLIWYPRTDKTVWAHIAATSSSPLFLRAALDAVFAAADEVHFIAPEGHPKMLRFAEVLGATEIKPPDDCCEGQDRQFKLQRNQGLHRRIQEPSWQHQ